MAGSRRLAGLATRLETFLQIPDGELAVALSGGADSAALGYLLASGGRSVRAIHVDHGMAASPRLERAAKEVAAILGVEIIVVPVDLGPAGASEGTARRARYGAFEEAALPGEAVLTAHTRDDQAETVVMNLLRGAGSRGLSGIPRHRPPNVYRPMLDVSRSDTRELALLAGLPFVDDPMNDDTSLTRNRVRLELLPTMSIYNPQLVASLARMANTLSAESAFLDREAGEAGVVVGDGSARVAVGALLSLEPALVARVLGSMTGSFRDHPGPGADEMERIDRVLRGHSRSEQLTGGLVARRVGPFLEIGPALESVPDSEMVALLPGRHRVGSTIFEVEKVESICRVAPLGTWWAIFDPDVSLMAGRGPGGHLLVEADGVAAWVPGLERRPVAWYQPGTNGYLSVLATEEAGWTSSR